MNIQHIDSISTEKLIAKYMGPYLFNASYAIDCRLYY
jgi:hypothetical protein